VKLLTLKEAEASTDIDIKLVTVRSSSYRVFGSTERIPFSEMAVADLRDGETPGDFEQRFRILDRHPAKPICLVQNLRCT
jgi:hypothetical protein